MSKLDDAPRRLRFSMFLMPVTAIVTSLAAAMVIVNDLDGGPARYTAFTDSDIEDIEFVARTRDIEAEIAALGGALERACADIGCDAGTLHPMIVASVEKMTEDELQAAIAAQSRILAESQAVRQRSLPGTEAARLAEMEILAAERIAALYDIELARR
ncbi:hypothetical protein [Jannaschia marina]|uniref:hypothetical protein n=1 Tax=Jannaschia marina TaxID=2741674 RepID=UPI0015C79F26|nr:hypothetical protein [Jannaschia marina]